MNGWQVFSWWVLGFLAGFLLITMLFGCSSKSVHREQLNTYENKSVAYPVYNY